MPAVAALVQRAYAPWVPVIGRRPAPMDDDFAARCAAGQAWCLDAQGALVGIVVLEDHGNQLWIDNVAVDPALHGQGHGRALLAFAEAEALRRGHGSLGLLTNALMTGNVALYGRHGFVETDRRQDDGFDRVFMAKPLPAIHALLDDAASMDMWLQRSEALHRTLRPTLPADYAATLRCMFAEGAAMAVLHHAGVPKALVVYRSHHTTFHGQRFYVDDLVTDAAERSLGHGAALLRWCEVLARARGCTTFALDSGVQRAAAHRFYFRHGLAIGSFGFAKAL